MKPCLKRAAFSSLACLFLAGCAAAPKVGQKPEQLEPGVVLLKRLNRRGREISHATGVIVSPDGKVASNRHVIFTASGGTDMLLARTSDGKEHFVLGLLAVHPAIDLVLLQLEPGRYSSLPLASEAALRAGESIRVVGHPHGGPQRVSPGTLVGIKDLSALLEDYVLLELLAHVAPGSSGSPVLNERGEVVGIVSGYQPSSQTAAVAWSAKPVARWLTNIRLGPQPLPLSPPPVTDDFAAFHDEEIRLWEKASRASRRAEAFAHIQNIVQRYPKSSAARVLLTGEHIERREYAKAEHQAREATQINPQNAAAWSLLSSVLNVQSRPAEAERAARHARSLKPDFPTATIQLSIALNAQGRHAEAAEVLLPLCEQDAHNPGAIRLLGASLRRAGQKALESQILNRLRLLDPGKARALESTMNPSGPERP